MDVKEYLKQNTDIGNKAEDFDPVFLSILEKSMKQIYINHARNRGATEEFITTLESKGSMTIANVVTFIFGEPPDPQG